MDGHHPLYMATPVIPRELPHPTSVFGAFVEEDEAVASLTPRKLPHPIRELKTFNGIYGVLQP
jgi:hypothetical protein